MTRLWTRKLTLLKLGAVLVLMGVLGVVVMDTRPASAATMATVSAGGLHTCAVTTTGGVKCWGLNNSGRLGDGTTTPSNVPVDVSGLSSGIATVSAGGVHTCALTTTGGVKCWGDNFSGQLGDGTTTLSNVPVDVSGLSSGIAAVSAGGLHTCALTTTGGVKCWGRNFAGQLGDGTTTSSSVPVDVSGLTSGMDAVSAGGSHTCALTSTGGIKCWGGNFDGQLGDGTTTSSSVPVDVSGLTSGIDAVSAGERHTCALTATGGIKCWGNNIRGQLGDGTTTDSNVPVDVSSLASGMDAVSAGDSHTCALTTMGGIKCWGDDFRGQLGDGTNTNSNVPVDVSGLASGMDTVSAGVFHTCALTGTGGAKCWGANFGGVLGDGTTTASNVPVDVSASGMTVVSVGAAHTCALTGTGVIKCWGTNFDGQLGSGTHIDTSIPVAVHVLFTLEDHDARIMAAIDGLSGGGGGGGGSAAVAAIEAKLDAGLDGSLSTRASQISVDTLEAKLDAGLDDSVSSRASKADMNALGFSVDSRASQKSVDALGEALGAVEAKLDVDLDGSVVSRASQVSVDALEAKLDADLNASVSSRSTQASVDVLEAKLDALVISSTGASQASVDALSLRMDDLEAKLDEILLRLATPSRAPVIPPGRP